FSRDGSSDVCSSDLEAQRNDDERGQDEVERDDDTDECQPPWNGVDSAVAPAPSWADSDGALVELLRCRGHELPFVCDVETTPTAEMVPPKRLAHATSVSVTTSTRMPSAPAPAKSRSCVVRVARSCAMSDCCGEPSNAGVT